jgi:hypothetical protein
LTQLVIKTWHESPDWYRIFADHPVLLEMLYRDLVNLKISVDGGGNDVLFNYYQFPALQTFGLAGANDHDYFRLTSTSQLSYQLSSCSLTHLFLKSLDVETDELLRILGNLSSLKSLVIDLPEIDRTLLCEFLACDSRMGARHLPNFTYLAISVQYKELAYLENFSAEEFSAMVYPGIVLPTVYVWIMWLCTSLQGMAITLAVPHSLLGTLKQSCWTSAPMRNLPLLTIYLRSARTSSSSIENFGPRDQSFNRCETVI